MKKQSRSDALNSFGKGLVWIVGIVFIGLFAFNHTMKNDVMSSDSVTEETVAYTSEKKEEELELIEANFDDFEDDQITFTFPMAKFVITDAYKEDDHLILEFHYTNLSDEATEPLKMFNALFDEATQEDDNAIYDLDVNHFYDLMNEKEVEKISSGNPKIKPDGFFEFYVPFELHDDSDVTFVFNGINQHIKINLD